jgi:hypothetical protein
MKEKRRKKKGIYVALLVLVLSGSASLVFGQPVVARTEVVIKDSVVEKTGGCYQIISGGFVDGDGTLESNGARLTNVCSLIVNGGRVLSNGIAIENFVVLRGGRVASVYGGYVGNGNGNANGGGIVSGMVKGNNVTVEGVSVLRERQLAADLIDGVYGGKVWVSGKGIATGNTIILINAKVKVEGFSDAYVCGGCVINHGEAIWNEVKIKGGVWRGSICGGSAGEGTARGNIVTLEKTEIEGNVFGGRITAIRGNATDNEINIVGSCIIRGGLYGGYIVGRHSRTGDAVWTGDVVTGNTLNVRSSLGVEDFKNARGGFLKFAKFKNFENINFNIREDEICPTIGIAKVCPQIFAARKINLRKVKVGVVLTKADPSELEGLAGNEAVVLMRSDEIIENYDPSNVIFRVIENGDGRRCISHLSLDTLCKMLVLTIKWVLPEPPVF